MRFLSVTYLFLVAISLCPRFAIATTNLLNRLVFFISVSAVDLDFLLRLEDSEAEEEEGGENDERVAGPPGRYSVIIN